MDELHMCVSVVCFSRWLITNPVKCIPTYQFRSCSHNGNCYLVANSLVDIAKVVSYKPEMLARFFTLLHGCKCLVTTSKLLYLFTCMASTCERSVISILGAILSLPLLELFIEGARSYHTVEALSRCNQQ